MVGVTDDETNGLLARTNTGPAYELRGGKDPTIYDVWSDPRARRCPPGDLTDGVNRSLQIDLRCPVCAGSAGDTYGRPDAVCGGCGADLPAVSPEGEHCLVYVDSREEMWGGLSPLFDLPDGVLEDAMTEHSLAAPPEAVFLADRYHDRRELTLFLDGVPNCPGCRRPVGDRETERHHWDYDEMDRTVEYCWECHRLRIHRRGKAGELSRLAAARDGVDSWVDLAVLSLAESTDWAAEPGWLDTLGLPDWYEPGEAV